jgi:S-adenosylmethionine:tRNA ribosyltransferase-isomerase
LQRNSILFPLKPTEGLNRAPGGKIDPVLVSDFDFDLPEELIAQQPSEERSGARMLQLDRESGQWRDGWFREFPELLRAGDVLVLNDSRVIPARLLGRKVARPGRAPAEAQGVKVEALLTEQVSEWEWRALVRPGKKVQAGDSLVFTSDDGESALTAVVIEHGEFGERLLEFAAVPDFLARLEKIGHMPLPPYIRRPDDSGDRQRYQTVYAQRPGSAAAPTAGLHFTPEVLEQIRAGGVTVVFVTLHVGLGTFQPVRVERVDEIRLHAEHYTLPEATASAVNAALSEGRRVIAAGTTTVRTLEHCALITDDGPLVGHSGATSIFISPGFEFRVVSGLLTNFHLPQSSLLMLVSAFAGRERLLAAYRHAVQERYRFFSYGDCMFIF